MKQKRTCYAIIDKQALEFVTVRGELVDSLYDEDMPVQFFDYLIGCKEYMETLDEPSKYNVARIDMVFNISVLKDGKENG